MGSASLGSMTQIGDPSLSLCGTHGNNGYDVARHRYSEHTVNSVPFRRKFVGQKMPFAGSLTPYVDVTDERVRRGLWRGCGCKAAAHNW